MIKHLVIMFCQTGFAVQAGTPMAVNDDDTLSGNRQGVLFPLNRARWF